MGLPQTKNQLPENTTTAFCPSCELGFLVEFTVAAPSSCKFCEASSRLRQLTARQSRRVSKRSANLAVQVLVIKVERAENPKLPRVAGHWLPNSVSRASGTEIASPACDLSTSGFSQGGLSVCASLSKSYRELRQAHGPCPCETSALRTCWMGK